MNNEFSEHKKLNLNGQVAVVTGGATGIGRTIALVLAHRGAVVMVADINEAAAKVTASDLGRTSGRS